MGACDFYQVEVAKDAKTAYNNACRDAEDEYGHQEGYNGTISTTSGYRMFTPDLRGRDPWKVAEKLLDEDAVEKWGPAGCIEITGTKLGKETKERRGLKGKRGYRVFLFFGWAAS